MFIADKLLVEKAQIALLSAAGDEPCVVSGALAQPYQALSLAIFRGDVGKRMASQACVDRRLAFGGGDHRVIADLSEPLGQEAVLLIENA